MVEKGQVDTLQILPCKLPGEVNHPHYLEALKSFDGLNSNGKQTNKQKLNMPESSLNDASSNSYYLTCV